MTRALCAITICGAVAVAIVALSRSPAFSVGNQLRTGAETPVTGLAQRNPSQFLAADGPASGAFVHLAGAFVAVGLGAVALRALVVGASARSSSASKTTYVSLGSSVEPTLGGYVRDQLVACRAQLKEEGAPSAEEVDQQMEAIKQLKDQMVGGAATALFVASTMADSAGAYPIFAQQNYKYPQELNGKIACANCHLQYKSASIMMPHEVLPDTIFKIKVNIPAKYDIKRQLAADGTKAELNVGAIAVLPEKFKLAPRDRLPKSIKKEMKGLAWAPYSKEYPNIIVAGPVPGKTFINMILPILAPTADQAEFGKLEASFGANRGRGQVYPNGNMSNNNAFKAAKAGTITAIDADDSTAVGTKKVSITTDKGDVVTVDVLPGATFVVGVGDKVAKDQELTTNPNVGGFGQADHDIVMQDPNRVYAMLAVTFSLFISQLAFVLKKKQFEKVQLAEGF